MYLGNLQRFGQVLAAGKMKPHIPPHVIFELEKSGKLFHPSEFIGCNSNPGILVEKDNQLGTVVPWYDMAQEIDSDEVKKHHITSYHYSIASTLKSNIFQIPK